MLAAMYINEREPASHAVPSVRSEPRSAGIPTGLAVLQRTAGNRAVAGLLAVQRQSRPGSVSPIRGGFVETTPFGRFWVTTDATARPPRGSGIPTAVTPSRLTELRAIWERIETRTGRLVIDENGHAGFRRTTCQAPGLVETGLVGFQGCGDRVGHRV